MFANKYYENDIEYTVKLHRFIFQLLGVWPFMETSLYNNFKRFSRILICYFLLYIELISAFLHIFFVEKQLYIKFKIASSSMFTILAIIKYSSLMLNKSRMKSCLMRLQDDWRKMATANGRDFMLDRARAARHILILCSIFMYSSGFYFRTIMPLSRGKSLNDQNITIRYLPCPSYFIFFDGRISPAYEIIFCIQFLSGFVKYTITVAICSLVALFAMHTCAQLEILMTLMNGLVDESDMKDWNNRLAVAVEYQIRTRAFLQLVHDTLGQTSLMEVLGCTIFICLLGYHVLSVRLSHKATINLIIFYEWNNVVVMFSYLVLLTSIGFNVFILCFIGEQISLEAEKLALTMSTLAWYRLPDTRARSLILIMAISNIPMKFRAGKFMDLSLRTFGDIIKTALAYFNFIRKLME